MAKRVKKPNPRVEGIHMSRTLQDIYEAEKLREKLEKIPVGRVLFLPSELAEIGADGSRREERPRHAVTVRYKVVGKNRQMLVCQRDNGTRECFTFSDLVLLEKKYGGLVNGKPE